jgi:hypothetical protein
MAPPPPPPGATQYPPLPPLSPPPRPPDSTDLDNGISMIPEEQVSLGLSHAVQSQYLMGNAYQVSEVMAVYFIYIYIYIYASMLVMYAA